MTLLERAQHHNLTARSEAAHLRVGFERGLPVVYGTWVLGNDYRNKTTLYGAYPPGYLQRVMSLFPDADEGRFVGRYRPAQRILHVFSGSLPQSDLYLRVDSNPEREPDSVLSAYDLPGAFAHDQFRLVVADPPYSAADAERYGTPMVNRRKALAAIAGVVPPGGHLAWLDTVWPMHRKAEWRTCGRITVIRSTNHRVRLLTLFERQP